MPNTTTTTVIVPARRAVWRYVGGLAPVVLLWAGLAGWLAYQLAERAAWSDQADEATIVEWLNETRTFRQSLPELVAEYERLPEGDARRALKRDEIAEQLKALAEPMRMFANQLPSFPEVYSLEVHDSGEPIVWRSPVPRPDRVRSVSIPVGSATITCLYRMHAFNRLAAREADRQQTYVVAGVLLVTASLLAALFVSRFIRREHAREIERLSALAEKEHRERDLYKARLENEETEKAAAQLHRRAIEAEKAALEVKSQIHASIGIMAGSYAHNIKNLLVRPNDLLARCLDGGDTRGMIDEVRTTLGTVTERLQQILKTVRRDPNVSHAEPIDLADLVKDLVAAWEPTARDKWKMDLRSQFSPQPSRIVGDASHLTQALENLLFNARDATFEKRNRIREDARRCEGEERKKKLLEAAAWKGECVFAVDGATLSVRDNGIGMTAEVKANCLESHFTTKRDNALYEGYTAGMGLGLSFVAMVLKQHGAELTIESAEGQGAEFRVVFSSSPPLKEGR